MNNNVVFTDLGFVDYQQAWSLQEEIFDSIVNFKAMPVASRVGERPSNHLFFCEHNHVYTLGKSGVQNNLLINDDFLKKIGATYYKINRGGDITYHGPGQIVGYPIFDLDSFGLGIKDYIHKLEDVIIRTLSDFGIVAGRKDGATGVWLDVGKQPFERKICAIGVRAGRFVTMHGFALNVNTNLQYFNHINPCGFVDSSVTSVQKELGRHIDVDQCKAIIKSRMSDIFEFEYV